LGSDGSASDEDSLSSLDLHYAVQIDADSFAEEHRRLKAQISTLESQVTAIEREETLRAEAVDQFTLVAELLAEMNLDVILTEATAEEKRILVEDLVDSVFIYPDQITVQVSGAPPILVALEEVGLTQGCKPVVSEAVREARRNSSATSHWWLDV
jgi:cell division septum initiation protein DivIVA